jgi:hypothetical protein
VSAEEDETKASESRETRGLRRLMLKLPALRARLQILQRESGSLAGLAEAYEDASVMYFSLLRNGNTADPIHVREYQQICAEIEDEVTRYCVANDTDAPN